MKKELTFLCMFILMPLWICIGGAVLGLDSVGPMVPITFVVNAIALPVCLFLLLRKHSKWPTAVKIILAILAGLFLAKLTFASYMVMTPWFGVDNFQWL